MSAKFISMCTVYALVCRAEMDQCLRAFEGQVRASGAVRKPLAELQPRQRAVRLNQLQRVVQLVLGDDGVTLKQDTSGHTYLRGGCMDTQQDAADAGEGYHPGAIDVIRKARQMGLSLRQTLKVPRRCTRVQLLQEQARLMPYRAKAHVVRASGGRQRAAATAPLSAVVDAQMQLARDMGCFKEPTDGVIKVLLCPDATPLWRSSATRCDVYTDCWVGGPEAAGKAANWGSWWVMDGGDDVQWLRGIDEAGDLNGEIVDLENRTIVIGEGGRARFQCFLTGDGKGMQAGNHGPGEKCWCCNNVDGLEQQDTIDPVARWGAFLRAIPTDRRVGDYVHAACRICCAIQKRVGANVSQWVREGDGRGAVGALQDLWGEFSQEAKRIPVSERVAQRPTSEKQFDLTSARMFLENSTWQMKLVNTLREYYPDRTVEGGKLKVYTVIQSLLFSVARLHKIWRTKTLLTPEEVDMAEAAAKKVGECWKALQWRATTWVHWTVAHSAFYTRKYRTIYFFSSIPTEYRNSAFKVELKNSFRGWALQRPLYNRAGLTHVLNMHGVDIGLRQLKDLGTKVGKKRVRVA